MHILHRVLTLLFSRLFSDAGAAGVLAWFVIATVALQCRAETNRLAAIEEPNAFLVFSNNYELYAELSNSFFLFPSSLLKNKCWHPPEMS